MKLKLFQSFEKKLTEIIAVFDSYHTCNPVLMEQQGNASILQYLKIFFANLIIQRKAILYLLFLFKKIRITLFNDHNHCGHYMVLLIWAG